MPTLNFQRIDLDLIYPPFLERILDAIAACEQQGFRYIATSGYRTFGAQQALWAQGRTKKGKVVTNALGGQSAHNFGLAIDFVRDLDAKKPGVQDSWNPADYATLIREVEKRGLHSGRGYRDWPHVGWPGYVSAEELAALKSIWERQEKTAMRSLMVDRLREVWQSVKIPS